MRVRLHPFRRLGAILLGVLILHTSWIASVSACEMSNVAAQSESATPAHEHAHAHHQSAAPEVPASHHESASVICPMAMACTQNAMTTVVPTVTTRTVPVVSSVPDLIARSPRTVRVAPDTPPPRA